MTLKREKKTVKMPPPRERGAEEGAGAEGSQAGLLRVPLQSDREQRHQATPFPIQALCQDVSGGGW